MPRDMRARRLGFEVTPGDATENGVSRATDYDGPGEPRVLFRRQI